MTPRFPFGCQRAALLPRSFSIQLSGVILLVMICNPARAQIEDRSAPTSTYFAAINALFYEGEYRDALRQFQDEWRGAIKNVQTRWIDSICYHTMIGECYYHMGRLDEALEHYTSALRLYLTFPDWMIRVQFPPAIRPSSTGARIPWGPSTRRARLGDYPDWITISQGRINNNQQWQRGGVVQPATLFPIDPQEIVRCTSLSIRRRTELLGPLAKYDPLTAELIATLSQRPAQPNHWSQVWIDVMLGLAMVAGGKETEAIPLLTRGTVAAGEFDHLLTCTALLELGRLALMRGDYTPAIGFFHEASISAAYYADGGVLEESLRYGAVAHLVSNRQGVYPPLLPAADWARVKDLRQLRASILLSVAEQLAVLGQTGQAAATLEDAGGVVGRRTMGGGWIGAKRSYLQAMVLFQQRDVAGGSAALSAAMSYMQHGSPWLNQILQVDRRFTTGQITVRGPITTRAAMELYAELLRDPAPADWSVRPMESLAVLVTPHPQSFEHWFLVARERKEHERALEITDRARRHRFFSSLAFGGRLQSLRWILEAPETAIGQNAVLERQNLLAQYPAYAALSQQARGLRASLEAMPLVSGEPEASRRQSEAFEQLAAVSAQQEAILREIAVRREAASLVFPPLRTTKEIQEALPEGHVMLVFFAAGKELYGFLLNREKHTYWWHVPSAAMLGRRMVSLFRELGLFEQNRELSLQELEESEWQQPARQLLDDLLEGSQVDLSESFPELVIVPDGSLWYVPFEMLQVNVEGKPQSLISRFRIRYAPTASLGVPDGRGRPLDAETGVVVGRLYPRDEEWVAQAAFERLAKVVPRSVALPGKPPLPAPSALYTSRMDQLIVLDDIDLSDAGPYTWAPVQLERNKPGNSLGDWLALPWGGPEVVVLPGFHTAAESSLKRANPLAPGAEIFLSVCGMLSSGSRTLLVSRWRTGGQSSFDIVREFAQELPHTAPADAWQRAVLVTADTRLELEREPRIKRAAVNDPPKADHPFFWAGYMLIDPGTAAVAEGAGPAEGEPAEEDTDGEQPKPAAEPRRGVRRS